jgi:hypothetical protein
MTLIRIGEPEPHSVKGSGTAMMRLLATTLDKAIANTEDFFN